MITVIDSYNEGTLEMYEGMSLQEATAQFVLESNQLVNDFMMDLLLTEHAYLVENGHEIEYTTLGEANDNGLSFLDKVNNLIQNAKTLFLKIVNNIIAFITEKVTQVTAWFKKLGMDKSKVAKAFAQHGDEKVECCACMANVDEFLKEFADKSNSGFIKASDVKSGAVKDDNLSGSGDVLEACEEYLEDKEFTASEVANGVISMIFNSPKAIANVKKQYKSAVDSLEKLKKRVAGKKSLDAESINDQLTTIRAAIMADTYILKDCAKIYSKLMKSALGVAKDLVKMGKPEKAEKAEEAPEAEEVETEEAPKAEEGSDKGCDRSQKLREACELVLAALKESEEEESQYDGKFFRV